MNEAEGDFRSTSRGDATQDDPTTARERMRAMIREEIDAFHPTDDARQPLELIVESALRYTEKDGVLMLTAAEEATDSARSAEDDASPRAVIRAVLEGIRRTRPPLFKPAPDETAADPAAPPALADAQPDNSVPQRDWLAVSAPPPPVASAGESARIRLSWSGLPAGAWFHRQMPRWREAAARHSDRLRSALRQMPGRLQGRRQAARAEIGKTSGDRFWHIRPLVLGALAALLALVSFVALRTGGASDPDETGAVPAPTSADSARLHGVPDVIDTSTLSLDGKVVRLFGVEWASGGGKPDDLKRYLSGRDVTCDPVAATNTYRCQIDGKDLSTVVLYNGGGRATAQATADMKAAAEHARQSKIGVWSK